MNDELDHSNMIGVDLAKHCGEPLFKYAVQAYEDCKNQRISEALKQIVLNIIITGGIISTLIETEKYNGAIPHSIFYGSTPIPACEQNHLHGEIVAYACLPQLMHEQRMEDFERQFKINRALELPTSLAEIDIQIGQRRLRKASRRAPWPIVACSICHIRSAAPTSTTPSARRRRITTRMCNAWKIL